MLSDLYSYVQSLANSAILAAAIVGTTNTNAGAFYLNSFQYILKEFCFMIHTCDLHGRIKGTARALYVERVYYGIFVIGHNACWWVLIRRIAWLETALKALLL